MQFVAPPNVGDVIDEKYVLDSQLGQGGMGTVFAGRSMQTGERVAVKVMLDVGEETDDVRTRFMNEAHLASRIDSPHVARPLDSGFWQGLPYIVMELMEGEDVENSLIRRGKLPIAEAVDIVVEIADALALAHQQGIIHRDIKPANVFLARGADGSVTAKLLDFGISKAPPGMGNPSLTKTSSVMGSPMYMSPEQLKSSKGVDARTDVWSLAIVLFETLTGEAPFDGGSFAALFSSILTAEIPPVRSKRPDCPPQIEMAVAAALSRDREKRTQSIEEFALSIWSFGSPRIEPVVARLRARLPEKAPDSDRTVIAPENSQEALLAETEEDKAPDSDRDRTMFVASSPYASDPRLGAASPMPANPVNPPPPTAPVFSPQPGAHPMTAAMAFAPPQPMEPVPPAPPPASQRGPQPSHSHLQGTMMMPMAPPHDDAHTHPAQQAQVPYATPQFPVSDPRMQAAQPAQQQAQQQQMNAGPWNAAPAFGAPNLPKKQGSNALIIIIVAGVVAMILASIIGFSLVFFMRGHPQQSPPQPHSR